MARYSREGKYRPSLRLRLACMSETVRRSGLQSTDAPDVQCVSCGVQRRIDRSVINTSTVSDRESTGKQSVAASIPFQVTFTAVPSSSPFRSMTDYAEITSGPATGIAFICAHPRRSLVCHRLLQMCNFTKFAVHLTTSFRTQAIARYIALLTLLS